MGMSKSSHTPARAKIGILAAAVGGCFVCLTLLFAEELRITSIKITNNDVHITWNAPPCPDNCERGIPSASNARRFEVRVVQPRVDSPASMPARDQGVVSQPRYRARWLDRRK